MKKILKGTLIILLSLAILIGCLELFSSYKVSNSINENAPVKTALKIKIKTSPEKIWKIMSDVNHWESWHSDVQEPVLVGTFKEGNSFDWKSGGLTIHSTIHTAIPYSKIGWSGPAFGSFAIHNWTFTQMNGYTEVRVNESMEGWLVTLMQQKFQKGLEQSLRIWLNNLKFEAEKNSIN
ncbi:hypothetical protein ASE21_19135 [Flavobacterium sp. Root901]|uniref:SRPBCC family protein n=1 Tax=Flavobacterium sp. Root901 TaxID=1736605 RepID=UPI0007105BB7|nr:SRPBCC family protein [Flavobacterium sp. Root901]KRD07597.1 hypothetical protein ASE21_19135 [Flavobacterium sp. Root901]